MRPLTPQHTIRKPPPRLDDPPALTSPSPAALPHVDEVAGPILFLCTLFAGFISGEIFNVNGGAVLAG